MREGGGICANTAEGERLGMLWFEKFLPQSLNTGKVQRSTNPSPSVFFLNTTPATLMEHSRFAWTCPEFWRYVYFTRRYSVNLANHSCIISLHWCSFGLQMSHFKLSMSIFDYNKMYFRDDSTILFLKKKFSMQWTANSVFFFFLKIYLSV